LGALVFFLRLPAAPLRVVALQPEAAPADDGRLRLAASSVLVAELSSLASLEGIAPLDPSQVDEDVKTPVRIARLAAADEVLSARLEKDGELARVSLRRIQGEDGRVLWSRSFSVPTEARDLRQLADAVQLQIRQAYAGHSLRAGTPELAERDEDYAAFVEVTSRVDSDLPQLAGFHLGSQQLHGVGHQRMPDLRDVAVRQLVGGIEGGVEEGYVHLLLLQEPRQRARPGAPAVGVGHVEDGRMGSADGVAVLVPVRHLSAIISEGEGR